METPRCPRCGNPLVSNQKDGFVHCGHCSHTFFMDSGVTVDSCILPFTIPESEAREIFKRWTAGPEMAADLERDANINSVSRHFFPVYRFSIEKGGTREVITRPARVSTLPGIQGLRVPAGKLKLFRGDDDHAGAELLKPDISIATHLACMEGDVKEQSLIFVPIFTIAYEYLGNSYIVVIDGSGETVYPGVYPVRSSRPYSIVMVSGIILGFLGAVGGLVLSPFLYILLGVGFLGSFAGGLRIAKAR